MNWKNGSLRIWIFRALVLIACVMMVVSFIMPWWVGRFTAGEEINIYGWGLRHNVTSVANYIVNDVTPMWQVILAWVYVGVSITLALFSTWIRKWWGQILLGIVGSGLIAYAAVAINVVVKNRLETFGIPLEGFYSFSMSVPPINASLQSGYRLAYIAGGIMLALALLRSIIVGKNIEIIKSKESLSL
jgi:hypothetical protein